MSHLGHCWGYFTKEQQVSQFRRIHNIILGIHEDDIPSNNSSGRASIEEEKLKLQNKKEEDQKAAKLSCY